MGCLLRSLLAFWGMIFFVLVRAEGRDVTSGGSAGGDNGVTAALPPGYPLSSVLFAKTITIDAEYSGGFSVMLKFSDYKLEPSKAKTLRVFHKGKDITRSVDVKNGIVTGYATDDGVFVAAFSNRTTEEKPAPDIWPPHTELSFNGPVYSAGNGIYYVSSRTLVNLKASDDREGAVKTYYVPGLTSEMFSEGFTKRTLDIFLPYTSGFSLEEGESVVGYASLDAAGNYEMLKTATLRADCTPPLTMLKVNGKSPDGGATTDITAEDAVALYPEDPLSRGVASGVGGSSYCVDVYPCGSASSRSYSRPLHLPPGRHTVYYFSADNAGNTESVRRAGFAVARVR